MYLFACYRKCTPFACVFFLMSLNDLWTIKSHRHTHTLQANRMIYRSLAMVEFKAKCGPDVLSNIPPNRLHRIFSRTKKNQRTSSLSYPPIKWDIFSQIANHCRSYSSSTMVMLIIGCSVWGWHLWQWPLGELFKLSRRLWQVPSVRWQYIRHLCVCFSHNRLTRLRISGNSTQTIKYLFL